MAEALPSTLPTPLGGDGGPLLGLIGSPNSGKTTLFNALTGLRARVGNYPGVTVERREGEILISGRRLRILDLPGTYSLSPISADEAVVLDAVSGEIPELPAPDALVVVADSTSLDRSMLFVAQVLRLARPTCLVLTMMDELRARGGDIDCERLEAALGIPVIPVVGHRGLGLDALRAKLASSEGWERPQILPPESADERSGWARSILEAVRREPTEGNRRTEAIDRIVLHPVLGTLLFVAVMTLFFQLIFTVAAPLMDAIDAGVGWTASAVRTLLPAGFAADLLADGVIAGVGSVVIFLPQIVLLFTLLYLLEDVGYMARAAFVVDRLMARVGLEGRAFVALLSSYACAVPGIMAARTVPSPTHRLVTILVAPLMTCSARLPVYAILIAAFVPAQTVFGGLGLQGLVLLSLYLAGTVAALGLAAVLRRWVAPGEGLPFYLELPPYRIPPLRLVVSQVWGAASAFLRRAGTIILAVTIVLWFLLNFPKPELPAEGMAPERAAAAALEQSAAGQLGHAIEPLIAPLGFDWKIGVGLVASLAAREVIVATLAQIYATAEEDDVSLREALKNDIDPRTGEPVFTLATVASLLVFFVFALQCMSTLAVMRRETASLRWPAFSFFSLLGLAWVASFVTYRVVHALTT